MMHSQCQYHGIIDWAEANRFGEDDKQQLVHLPDPWFLPVPALNPFQIINYFSLFKVKSHQNYKKIYKDL
jgi:hypothetical protein